MAYSDAQVRDDIIHRIGYMLRSSIVTTGAPHGEGTETIKLELPVTAKWYKEYAPLSVQANYSEEALRDVCAYRIMSPGEFYEMTWERLLRVMATHIYNKEQEARARQAVQQK